MSEVRQILERLHAATDETAIWDALAVAHWHDHGYEGGCPASRIPSGTAIAAHLRSHGLSDRRTAEYRKRLKALLVQSARVHFDNSSIDCNRVVAVSLAPYEFGWGADSLERWRENVPALHGLWACLDKGSGVGMPLLHPLGTIVRAWLKRPRSPENRHLITTANGLVRSPALVSHALLSPLESPALVSHALLSPLEIYAVTVDGIPVGSPRPDMRMRACRRGASEKGEMRSSPRTLGGLPLDDAVLVTLARYPLTGDERSPLRSDSYRLSLFTCALTGSVTLTEREGVQLLTGSDAVTEASKRRWWEATKCLRNFVLTIDPDTQEWVDFARVWRTADGDVSLSPPPWMMKAGYKRYALSGALFRSAQLDSTEKQGTTLGYWGSLHRTLAGLEAALSYGTTAGRGRDGRIPDALRPANGRSGPGPAVFVPWRNLISLSGEPVTEENKSVENRRYGRRVRGLIEAGYLCNGKSPAKARDTVEIHRVQKGNRWQPGGLWVRATARLVEAQKLIQSKSKEAWIRMPADCVLTQVLK